MSRIRLTSVLMALSFIYASAGNLPQETSEKADSLINEIAIAEVDSVKHALYNDLYYEISAQDRTAAIPYIREWFDFAQGTEDDEKIAPMILSDCRLDSRKNSQGGFDERLRIYGDRVGAPCTNHIAHRCDAE